MATLAHLVEGGLLTPFQTSLDEGEAVRRWLYATPAFVGWVIGALPALRQDRSRKLTPLEQVELVFHDYIVGLPMAHEIGSQRLKPLRDNVWEFKTEDVRVFGWFAKRRRFIAVGGALKRDLKPAARYGAYLQGVLNARAALPLDEPKMMTGANYDAVL